MAEHCPRCGLVFEREEDFFLGAYVVNLVVTEGLLVLALFAYVIKLASDGNTPSLPFLALALILAVAGPVAFFPFARTIWAAIDLGMRPVPWSDSEAPE